MGRTDEIMWSIIIHVISKLKTSKKYYPV
jgi:hypothetical protein